MCFGLHAESWKSVQAQRPAAEITGDKTHTGQHDAQRSWRETQAAKGTCE